MKDFAATCREPASMHLRLIGISLLEENQEYQLSAEKSEDKISQLVTFPSRNITWRQIYAPIELKVITIGKCH